jgi:hypothetical protein
MGLRLFFLTVSFMMRHMGLTIDIDYFVSYLDGHVIV